MESTDIWSTLEALPLASHIGETWWFPLLESIHVLTAMFVIGSLLFVDLRLLGLAARAYPVSRFARELLPWTWAAFAVATASGIGMFLTRASWYVGNRAFQIKLLLLLLAALNMLVFQIATARSIAGWDTSRPSDAARLAGAVSLALWVGITLAGRWVGHLS